MPGSRRMWVAEAKDLKPFRVRLLTYTNVGFLRCPSATIPVSVLATGLDPGEVSSGGTTVRHTVTR
ncbi:hypothetical protein GCM10028802_14640 [Terrabacter terrigena]